MTTLSRLRRSWRTLLLAALAGTAAGALAPPALAQRGARAAEVRGPRVLIALGPGGRDVVPLDVARTAALVRRIALDLDHVTVTEALAAIAGRSGVRLIYTEDVVPAANRVTLKAEAITTAAALTDVLLDTGVDLVFSSTGDEAVLVRRAPAARPQVGTIVGRVSDARSGDPVAGATIAIDGTRLGAVADADGRYRIANVPPGSYTLVARRIGYPPTRRAVEVTADQEVTADFALTTAPTSLEQVVVTGTAGGEQRRSIGNAVPVINAPEQLARSAAPDMGSLLNARAPGVVVAPNTGRLGAGPNIQIRGRSSMSLESSPLIYIDGVRVSNAVASGPTGSGFGSQNANIPGRLNDITPEDIDHIEVIKGPAAATLYGTEASNGVIQIITKRGAGRGKAQLSAQVQTGALWFRDPEGRIPTNFAPDGSGNIVAWNGGKTEKARGTPIFHNGQTRHYTAALSGGLDSLDYYVSTAYENDLGIESNNSLRQFASHANLTVHPNPKVDFGTSLSYIDRSSHLGADVGVSPILGAELGHTAIFPSARGFFPNFPPEIPEQLYDNSQAINR
ncbi:MAG: carboxypeptidase regulatory-like domain-containing protein, partial [Gemmatimonadaceae bacterium]|nr:carboxypeptidase regulatory-like domain-containing protein [Gemmatimonadaceae bacterium]